jgi:CDP-glycerol glycerophosphotransferase (TagB/SpsB family)
MAAGFQPLALENIWITGLPCHDFLRCEFPDLPEDLQNAEVALRNQMGGKRLILMCPTFRNDAAKSGYHFTQDEIAHLETWLHANNAILGIREHMADDQGTYSEQLSGPGFLHLPSASYPFIEVLYRVSDALITDYSSCFFDYMITGKPAISFAYDLNAYRDQERGTFYDLETVFPGPVCRSFADLKKALDDMASSGFINTDPDLGLKRCLFFAFQDANSAQRVVARVKRELTENPSPQSG